MLALQLLVPLRALLDDSGQRQRFGWSMYATETSYPESVVVVGERTRSVVPFASLVVRRRPEVDYARRLPRYVCERFPAAREVRIAYAGPGPEVTPCR